MINKAAQKVTTHLTSLTILTKKIMLLVFLSLSAILIITSIREPIILELGPHTDNLFASKLDKLIDYKIEFDLSNHYWQLNPKSEVPVVVQIRKDEAEFPQFDPRFTLSVYLRWITEKRPSSIKFHWLDWVDMSLLKDLMKKENICSSFELTEEEKLGSKTKQVDQYCHADNGPLGFKITEASRATKASNHKIIGKAHLFSTFPSPSKLVFLTHKASIEIPVESQENDFSQRIYSTGMLDLFIEGEMINVTEEHMAFASHAKENPYKLRAEIHLKAKDFSVDAMAEMQKHEKDPTKQNYVESIRQALAQKDAPKYFNEAEILKTIPYEWHGSHYDWKFFNKLNIGEPEQVASLHRLLKNWLQFSRDNDIHTWIAHGSLLSWYWNGLLFPWDTDIDVQVPVLELHKLARNFNQSLVIETVTTEDGTFDGMGRFFIDVGSSISQRTYGNGANNIDARFIDIDTGLYIDITGMSLTNEAHPSRYDDQIAGKTKDIFGMEKSTMQKNKELQVYNCRNHHFIQLNKVTPLRPGIIENQLAYFPSDYDIMIKNEYDADAKSNWSYRDYYYDDFLRNWISKEQVLEYLDDPAAWLADFPDDDDLFDGDLFDFKPQSSAAMEIAKRTSDKDKKRLKGMKASDYLKLLVDDRLFEEYMVSRNATRAHPILLLHHNDSEVILDYVKQTKLVGNRMRNDLYVDELLRRY